MQTYGTSISACRDRATPYRPRPDVVRGRLTEKQLQGWVSDWVADNDEAFTQLSAILDAVESGARYLEAHPSAPEKNAFAAMIAGALGARCEGSDGDFSLSIRDRFRRWRLVPEDVRHPLGSSLRARLVSLFEQAPEYVLWWKARKPEVRDLAIITLLGGQWPQAARRQQVEGPRAKRPTVLEVVGAEENAIRALISAAKKARPTGT